MRRITASAVLACVALAMLAAPAAAASSAPDLDAVSGCVSAHSASATYARGETPKPAFVNLIVATVAASHTAGARKVAKGLRRARTAPSTQAAIGAIAAWCIAHGVPPLTLPPTTTAG